MEIDVMIDREQLGRALERARAEMRAEMRRAFALRQVEARIAELEERERGEDAGATRCDVQGCQADEAEAPDRDRAFRIALDAALAELRGTLLAKRHDYGSDNLTAFGEYGILVRQGDKYHRLRNLLTAGTQPAAGEPRNESIDDTWLDMAGYAVLALLLRRGAL